MVIIVKTDIFNRIVIKPYGRPFFDVNWFQCNICTYIVGKELRDEEMKNC